MKKLASLLTDQRLTDLCPPSSVARKGAGAIAPPIGKSTKMQNEKNTKFLALLRLLYALEWTK